MGCDIHLYVERRVDGKWITADVWQGDEIAGHFYSDRNYDLFAILANVRNGIKTGEGFNPISEPRGVPDDACPEYLAEIERWGGDGHSHSHLTVRDLMEYDWTQVTHKQGFVTRRQYARLRINGSPDMWSEEVTGVRAISNEEMEALDQRNGKYDPWASYHVAESLSSKMEITSVSWSIPYYDAGGTFLATVLPRLWRLGAHDDVRITFFFDN